MSTETTSPAAASVGANRRMRAPGARMRRRRWPRPLVASGRWLGALYSAPFRTDVALDESLSLADWEQRQRFYLLRVIVFTIFVLQQALGIPILMGEALSGGLMAASTASALPAILAQTTLALLCVVCWILNLLRHTLLATILFIYGALGATLLAMFVFGVGVSDQGLFISSFLAIFILVAGFLLPRPLIWATAGALIVGVLLNLALSWQRAPAAHALNLAARLPAVALLLLLYLLLAALTWLFARSATTNVAIAQRARERERELAELKDQFLVTANHELRTPFMAMYGNIEFLKLLGGRATPEQTALRVQQALRAGEVVRKLLNAILDASLTAPGQFRIQAQPLTLAPLARTLLEQFDPREIGEPGLVSALAQERPVELRILPTLTVYADETRLRQVLANLLSNALKYSEPGSPIMIAAEEDATSDHVTLRFSDRGLGIPPEEAGRLFQRFVRLKRDQGGPVRGTGVGLYLCRALVEAMGGAIWVESSGIPGEGSTFVFTLPKPQPEASSVAR